MVAPAPLSSSNRQCLATRTGGINSTNAWLPGRGSGPEPRPAGALSGAGRLCLSERACPLIPWPNPVGAGYAEGVGYRADSASSRPGPLASDPVRPHDECMPWEMSSRGNTRDWH